MVALGIEELKQFTQKLFLGTEFDDFLLKEADIVTFNRFTIDGRIRQNFYPEEERKAQAFQEYSFWKVLRPVCFSLIKGKRLPGSFHVDLQADKKRVEKFLECRQLGAFTPDQVQGLYLHIRYEEGKLVCVTGTSLTIFTMDRSLEREWDLYIEEFLKKIGIASTH